MRTLEAELKSLQQEHERVERDFASVTETSQETQLKLGEVTRQREALAAQITPLQRLMKEVTAIRSGLQAQREQVVKEVENAGRSYDEIVAQINTVLPEARRKAVRAALDAGEKAIVDLKKAVQTLQHKRAEGEAAMSKVQQEARDHERTLQQILTTFRQLPGHIQAGSNRVLKLMTTTKTMIANGRIAEAFTALRALKQELDGLKELSDSGKVTTLVDSVERHWQEGQAAQTAITEKTAVLDQLKQQIVEKEHELQQCIQQRDADVKAALHSDDAAETTSESRQAEPAGQRTKRGRS